MPSSESRMIIASRLFALRSQFQPPQSGNLEGLLFPDTYRIERNETADDLLSPWQGFGVLCIWTVLALAVAAYLLERRDA